MALVDNIKFYFNLGLSQKEILSFLKSREGHRLSERTLKRILKKNSMYRRRNYTDLNNIIPFIDEQVRKSSQLHGYRQMHLKCLQEGFTVKRETVRLALQLIDPDGVEIRRRRRLRRRQYSNSGPNFLWHLDSYDKLKPYGICINGCTDGFSRYILWLRTAKTNNDPKVIASYYYDTIATMQGFPRCIRADRGTENGHVEKMQQFLHEECAQDTSCPPFMYGRSTANQRIESWWGILRKHNTQFWINFFEAMRDNLLFEGSFMDKSLIQFCFMKNIQVSYPICITKTLCFR